MPPFLLKNFKLGLDTRRDALTSQPGTFVTLENCFINQGAEIEQRKAFVRYALPTNTFGLEGTDSGLLTFGSIADPGGWPRGAVTGYQRLQHPAVTEGATFDAAFHAMTAVLWSYSFDGKALVAAQFSDGRVFLYYNGSIVLSSDSGIVLPGFANQAAIQNAQGANLRAQFIAIGWLTNFVSTAIFGPTNGPVVYVEAPITVTSIVSNITISSAAGTLVAASGPGHALIPGLAGAASFTVNGAPGSDYTLYAPIVPAGATQVTLMGQFTDTRTVDWAVSNNATASAIATAINLQSVSHGFTAAAVGAVVNVSSPIRSGTSLTVTPFSWGNLQVVATADAGANGNHAFANGYDSIPAAGAVAFYGFGGTWAVGDTWSIEVVTNAGNFTVGQGVLGSDTASAIAAGAPFNGYVFKERVYVSARNLFLFSAVGDPTAWEQQNTGAGFIPFVSQFGAVDSVQSFADYQGFLAVFGRRSIQIWETNADPAQFVLRQTMANIGTNAPFSTQAVGALDVYFLADSGVRSLRVRDSSNNAFVTDIGSPIDMIVIPHLSASRTAQSVIEPLTNQYWLYLDGTIYVLNNYPSLEIAAWSTFLPKWLSSIVLTITSGTTGSISLTVLGGGYDVNVPWHTDVNTTAADIATGINAGTGSNGYSAVAVGGVVTITPSTLIGVGSAYFTSTGDIVAALAVTYTSFTPQAFTVYNGAVYARSSDAVYSYGGPAGLMYDGSQVTVELPWLDDGAPTIEKHMQSIDTAMQGKWVVSGGTNPQAGTLSELFRHGSITPSITADSTFDDNKIPFSGIGTHFKVKFVSSTENNNLSKIGCLAVQYKPGRIK